jgi:hypothetical protein
MAEAALGFRSSPARNIPHGTKNIMMAVSPIEMDVCGLFCNLIGSCDNFLAEGCFQLLF